MYSDKISATHKDKKLDLRIHQLGIPAAQQVDQRKINPLYVLSIDPGTINLAIRMEERNNGQVKTILFELLQVDSKDSANPDFSKNIIEFFFNKKHLVNKTNLLIVEHQWGINARNVRVAQTVVTYFQTMFLMLPLQERSLRKIIEIDSTLKTKVLGGPCGSTKPIIKAWSKHVASNLLQRRGDLAALKTLQANFKKRDDLTDSLIQIEAYFKYMGYGTDVDNINLAAINKLLTIDQDKSIKDAERLGVSRKDLATFLQVADKFGLVSDPQETAPRDDSLTLDI